jgi:hypothetical protein
MPERALRLDGPSCQIIRFCDGQCTVKGIAEKIAGCLSRISTGVKNI